jgi:hypothetical protein
VRLHVLGRPLVHRRHATVRLRAAAVVLEEQVLRHRGLLVSWAACRGPSPGERSRPAVLDMESLISLRDRRVAGTTCGHFACIRAPFPAEPVPRVPQHPPDEMPDERATTGTSHDARLHVRASASAANSCAPASDDQQKRHSPDPLHPVHRHDVDACDLPIRGSSRTFAVATRHKQQRRIQAKAKVRSTDDRPRGTALVASGWRPRRGVNGSGHRLLGDVTRRL